MEYQKITNIEELNHALDEEHNDFVMLLSGGLLKSRRWITYGEGDGTYEVRSLVDDSMELLTPGMLMDQNCISNVGIAMRNGALFCEIDN